MSECDCCADHERYYVDRNFDHTGRVCVIVSPGQGVFEVDRQLATLTSQRTIDLGISIRFLFYSYFSIFFSIRFLFVSFLFFEACLEYSHRTCMY